MGRTYRIASIPGDGIGMETVPEGLRVLEAAARRFGFELTITEYDWSCARFKAKGAMMPEDGLQQLREHDAVYLGAVGWPDVADHVSLWGLLIPIRRGVRPVCERAAVQADAGGADAAGGADGG